MALLSTTVALWLLVYLVDVTGDASQGAASFDPQGRSCPLEIGLQKKNRRPVFGAKAKATTCGP
jgi:hypothetical protein